MLPGLQPEHQLVLSEAFSHPLVENVFPQICVLDMLIAIGLLPLPGTQCVDARQRHQYSM